MPLSSVIQFVQKLKNISLVRDSFWALLVRIVGAILLYGLNLLLARWAGVDAFGAYSLAWGWVMMLGMLLGIGVPAVQLRFFSTYFAQQNWEKLKGLIQWSVKRVAISTGVLSALGLIILNVLPNGLLLNLTTESRLLWTFASLMLPLVPTLKLLEQMLRGSRMILASQAPIMVIRPAGILIMAAIISQILIIPLSASTIMAVMLGNSILIWFLLIFFLYRSLPKDFFNAKPQYERKKWRAVSLPLLLNLSFGIVLKQSDILMIGAMVSAEAAGIYFAGARTAVISNKLLDAFLTGFTPRIAPLWEEGKTDQLQKMITKTLPWIFWPSAIITIILMWFAGDILAFWGDEFTIMAGGLQVLALAILFDASTGPVSSLLEMTGHQDKSAQIYGFSVGFNIITNLIGIYFFGIIGAAYATAATRIIRNLWAVVWVKKYLNLKSWIVFSPFGR